MEKFKLKLDICLILCIFYINGCASIVKGGFQEIPIYSNPSDAKIKIEDSITQDIIYTGKTPYAVTLRRGAGYFKSARYRVTIEKENYQTHQFVIQGSANGWYIGGNVFLLGFIGWLVVDPATGAMWTLSPDLLTANFSGNLKTSLLKKNEGLMITLKSDIPTSLVNKMKPINVKQ